MKLSPKTGADELVAILVVEDEPVLRTVTADDLRTRGYWVVEGLQGRRRRCDPTRSTPSEVSESNISSR
jgi:CheY-like chemotaxis protein